MPLIPASVVGEPVPGLERIYQGKVRDTYRIPDHPDKLLVVASDRISIFDFVLNALVAQKGAILTAMNHFWRTEVMKDLFPHDLIAAGSSIDEFLPESVRGNMDLHSRATVVKELDMIPCEAIVRAVLTGSSLKPYRTDRRVCGHLLPPELQDGDELPFPVFTPTTKAVVGHDEHITADSTVRVHGMEVERVSLQLFAVAQAHARSHGILLADTKVEMGLDTDGIFTVGDEVFTPDSSRFWELQEWGYSRLETERKAPKSYDKQFIREWGLANGINGTLDAEDLRIIESVHTQIVPEEVLLRTTQLYRYIFWRLTGLKLEAYQHQRMKIRARSKPVKIEVISGSASDLPQMMYGLRFLSDQQEFGQVETIRRHVISCHRNPADLASYAHLLSNDCIVIAGAGLAAALPGVLKALLVAEDKAHIPVIGVAFDGISEAANQAAKLSIEQLPGKPVLLNQDGEAYFGPEGFLNACHAAIHDEFLTPLTSKSSAPKPAQFDVPLLPEA